MTPTLPTPLESDSLPWTHGLVMAPFGTRIGIRVNSEVLLEQVRARLLPGWSEENGEEVDFLWSIFQDEQRSFLYYGEELLSQYPGLLSIFDSYFHLYVGDTARERTFVHAGVVGLGGRAMLLPGRSYAGKSTLTRALVDQGATYYSDDLAALDEEGRVHPYPKPMSLRTSSGLSQKIPALELGWRADLPPLPVRLIANLRFQEATPWTPMSEAQASFSLIENCVSIRREPARDMRCISRVSAQSLSVRGERGEAAEAARKLLEMLAAQP